jgi:hypothetical protein
VRFDDRRLGGIVRLAQDALSPARAR